VARMRAIVIISLPEKILRSTFDRFCFGPQAAANYRRRMRLLSAVRKSTLALILLAKTLPDCAWPEASRFKTVRPWVASWAAKRSHRGDEGLPFVFRSRRRPLFSLRSHRVVQTSLCKLS
jgi:hypothetical protein